MTIKDFAGLATKSTVRWRESAGSPRAGELTDFGVVHGENLRDKHIVWQDGQITDGRDEAALQHVEVRCPCADCGKPLCEHCGYCHSGCFLSADLCAPLQEVQA